MHALRAFYCHELKSPMSEFEKEQTWDFSILMQVPAKALMDAIMKAKPSALKGQYLKSITLATTMGPGVKVSTAKYC